MTIVGLTALLLSGVGIMSVLSKKRHIKHFKTSLFGFAAALAILNGFDFGDLLLPDIIDIGTEVLKISFSEKIYSTLVAVLGTIILLISIFITLKRLLQFIDGKSQRKIKKAVSHRICTALGGFFQRFTVKIGYRKIVTAIKKRINDLNSKAILEKQMKIPRPMLVLKFSRILI